MNKTVRGVNIPAIVSIETTLQVYYTRTQLNSADIRRIFGQLGNSRIVKLKDIARERMREKGIPCLSATLVHTHTAFEAWGIDVAALERNLLKLRELMKRK